MSQVKELIKEDAAVMDIEGEENALLDMVSKLSKIREDTKGIEKSIEPNIFERVGDSARRKSVPSNLVLGDPNYRKKAEFINGKDVDDF